MSEQTTETSPTRDQQFNAVRNEHGKTFQLGNREFPIKDLNYDSYIEFMELAQPILTTMIEALELTSAEGDPDVAFNPASFDIPKMIKLAGANLPKMVWLCCRQSDPKITVEEVKQLGHRPQAMIKVVLEQVAHNKMIQEFADFFQQMGRQLKDLAPDVAKVASPVSLTTPTA